MEAIISEKKTPLNNVVRRVGLPKIWGPFYMKRKIACGNVVRRSGLLNIWDHVYENETTTTTTTKTTGEEGGKGEGEGEEEEEGSGASPSAPAPKPVMSVSYSDLLDRLWVAEGGEGPKARVPDDFWVDVVGFQLPDPVTGE